MADQTVYDTLRMSDGELRALLDELSARRGNGKESSTRGAKRWELGLQRIVVTVVDLQGVRLSITAAPRTLSKTGVGCLTGRFIHLGTECVVHLKDNRRRLRKLAGKVIRCHHVSGRVHEFGVQFHEEVDPSDFVVSDEDQTRFQLENVDVSELTGRLLYVDDQALDQELMQHYLADSRIELLTAQTEEEAMRVLASCPDMTLVDYDLSGTLGTDCIARARRNGYSEPMLLITADKDQEVRFAAVAAGADEVIRKPATASLIHQAVAEYLVLRKKRAAEKKPAGPTASPEVRALFVGKTADVVGRIEAHLVAGDTEGMLRTLKSLMGTAAGFGFPEIAQAASGIVDRLSANSSSLPECACEIDWLINLCSSANAA